MRARIKSVVAKRPETSETFRDARHLIQQHIFSTLSTALSGVRTDVKAVPVDLPLASASLLTNYYRHQMVRNAEPMAAPQIRKLMGLADARHPWWKYEYNQAEARRPQYETAIKDLHLRKQCLQVCAQQARPEEDAEEATAINAEIIKIEETISKLRTIVECMQPVLHGSMHPDPGAVHEAVDNFLVGPNSPWRMRGIMIRIAGARKGQRAQSWKRYAGAYSINSVGFVNAEESKLQIPTKHGTFGLTVRLVWQKMDELPNPLMRISPDGIRYIQPFK